MHVHLGGHLAFYDPHKRSRFEVHLEEETALLDVVRRLGVPEAEITLAAVNREVVALEEARVRDADRLDLYPPMSGGAQRAPAARSEPHGGRPGGRGGR